MKNFVQSGGAVQEWRLHLGAHKTATTHIQQTLEAAQEELAGSWIDYIPHHQLQAKRIPDLRLRSARAWIGGSLLRRELMAKLDPHLHGFPRLVASNEDWIGASEEGLAARIYPKAGRRIGALTSAVPPTARLELFLSVRNWETFLPAAYATALMYRHCPFRFEAIRRRVLAEPPDWTDLVERILAAAPRSRLTVWPYEIYRKNARQIVSLISGYSFDYLTDIPDPVATRTPTERAVCEVEALPSSLPPQERLKLTRTIFDAANLQRDGKYMPFSDIEAALLRDAYADQLDRLARHPDLTFIRDTMGEAAHDADETGTSPV